MPIQYVNTGSSANKGDGDSLRTAFGKINNNFAQLVASIGGSSATITVNSFPPPNPSEGALWYDTVSGRGFIYFDNFWVDSNPPAVEPLTSVTTHIIPSVDLAYDLGSPTSQWRSLYVGTGTIYIGGVPLSINTSNNTLVVGSAAGTPPTTATTLATEAYVINYVTQYGGNAGAAGPQGPQGPAGSPGPTGPSGSFGDITFTATTITAPADSPIRIVSTDTIYNRALVDLDPVYGNVSLQAWSSENTRSDTNAWTTGTWEINIYGNPYMRFTGAFDLAYWITNTLQNSDPDTVSYSINEGPYIAWDGGSSADPSTGFVEIYTSGVNPPGNTTTNITSLAWKYRFNSRFEVGYNNGVNLDSGDQYIGINAGSYIQMYAKGSIDIDNSSQPGSDIEINAGDDIWIRGKDKTTSDSEGGDINIEAGNGGPADAGDGGGGGGDIRIIAGDGGNASSAYMGGVGGTIQMYSGDGGSANAANGRTSNNGGYLELQAGSAGFNDGDPAFGNAGGNLEIRAGNSNNYTDNGGNVIIQPGTNTAGTSTVAGYVRIQVPSSAGAAGGSWYFEGDGQTFRSPNGSTLGPEGMGGFGISNGTSGNPVYMVNKNIAGNYLADININAGDGISGEIAFNIWNTQTFTAKTIVINTAGNIVLPGGGVLASSGYDVALIAGDDGSSTYGHVTLKTNGPNGVNEFYMNSLGELTLPQGGAIQETQVTNELWGTTTTSLTLVPGGAANGTQRLEIYATGGGEGDHIHITSGDLAQTDIYLGNDTQFFGVTSNGVNVIQARRGVDSPSPGTPATGGMGVAIYGGAAGANGGDVNDGAGGGDIYIQGGTSSAGLGGPVYLVGGSGPNGSGSIRLSTDNGSTYLEFDKDKQLVFPSGGDVVFDSSSTSYIYGVTGVEFANGTTQTIAYGFVSPPLSSTSTGVAGALAQDATYFYVCTATNSWQRIAWDNTPW